MKLKNKKNFKNLIDFVNNIENLDPKTKNIFNRIFEIRKEKFNLKMPEKYKDFENQELIFVKDKVFNKDVVFNIKREKRPLPISSDHELKNKTHDPFCNLYKETPIDELGRIENESAITAANLSKMADYHSLVIFKKHNFSDLDQKDFVNAILLTNQWFQKINEIDQNIKTKILIWNYHFRSGASILHPHFQILAFKDESLKIKELKLKLKSYQKKFSQNYFDDYFYLAKKLKIGKEKNKFKIWVSLTPEKENGLNFYGDLNKNSAKFLWQIIKNLTKIGIQSFNIFYNYELNYGFFVDRGKISKLNSDIGSLEIFGIKIVSSDPFELAKKIFKFQ
jgi:hypothetical protein